MTPAERRGERRPAVLALLCGRSFSGKSTLARRLAARLPAAVIGFDDINAERGLYGGDGVPVEEWARTAEAARARDHLDRQENVVLDDTSALRFLRDEWRAVAGMAGASFALVWLDVDEAQIRERIAANRVRTQRRGISEEVLAAHLENFEPPTADERPILAPGTAECDAALVVEQIREVM